MSTADSRSPGSPGSPGPSASPGAPASPGPSDKTGDPLAPYRDTPVHLFLFDRALREQLKLIITAMKFTAVVEHAPGSGYLESVKLLAQLLIQKEGLFLVNPPQAAVAQGGKVRVAKDLPEFFASVNLLLAKARKDGPALLSRCVPVFQDIQFTQKRELTILQLSRHGIAGAFILKKQESLSGLSPQLRKIRMQEQVMERFHEVREYLCDYLPHVTGAKEKVQERLEELELTQRKAKADAMRREADKARQAKDWERAVACYKQAIDLYPQDPVAYLESGRVYVRLRKYPKALLRFAQAQELAEGVPEPNKEIGAVRILQVMERLEQGDSPDNPEIQVLLDDAVANFATALDKAKRIKALTPEEEEGRRGRDAVARIAGEIMKLELKQSLGKRHPVVAQLGALARGAIQDVAPGDVDQLPASQLIFLGLAALDERNFDDAERLLFRAAQDTDHFTEACDEIIYMGTVVRKEAGAARAIDLYTRLLALGPPREAAVHFNLAVAYCAEKRELEGAGAIVQALFLDPSLAGEEAFYKSPQLHDVLEKLTLLFDRLDKISRRAQAPELTRKAVKLQEDLEAAIMSGEDLQALRLFWNVAGAMPEFFEREYVAASKVIAEFMQAKQPALAAAAKPTSQQLGAFFAKMLARRGELKPAKRLIAHLRFKGQALHALERQGDEAGAANLLARAALCHPDVLKQAEFYANPALVRLGQDINQRLSLLDMGRIRR